MKRNEGVGLASLITAALIYGFYGIFVRTVGFEIPFYFAGWTRAFVTVLIVGMVLVVKRDWRRPDKKDWGWISARTLLGMGAFILSYIAFSFNTIGSSYFVFFGGSLIGGYFTGHLLFKEKLTGVKIIALVIAIAGLYLVYSGGFGKSGIFYLTLAFISGIFASLWNTFSKKISQTYCATQLNFMDNLLFCVFSLIISLVIQEKWVMVEFSTVWIVNMLAGLGFAVTGWLVVYGFKYLSAQVGSLVLLTEIIFGMILAWFFYGETVSLLSFVGGIMIVAAIMMPEYKYILRKSSS